MTGPVHVIVGGGTFELHPSEETWFRGCGRESSRGCGPYPSRPPGRGQQQECDGDGDAQPTLEGGGGLPLLLAHTEPLLRWQIQGEPPDSESTSCHSP